MAEITPAEAFTAAEVLWGVSEILKHDNPKVLMYRKRGDLVVAHIAYDIDWPDGVEVWPEPEKQWVQLNALAWKDFHGRPVRIDSNEDGLVIGELVGLSEGKFVVRCDDRIYIKERCDVEQ